MKKNSKINFPDIIFAWSDPVGSVVRAKSLPEDWSLKFLCQYLQCSDTTIRKLRRKLDFPSPNGPNSRRLFYSKTEVLLWLLKQVGLIEFSASTYIDNENNIYLSIYEKQKDSESSETVQNNSKGSTPLPKVTEESFLSTISENSFSQTFFKKYLNELIPFFNENGIDLNEIEAICYEVKNRDDLVVKTKNKLLLTYLKNARQYQPSKGFKKYKTTKSQFSEDHNDLDYEEPNYGDMLMELRNEGFHL